MQPLSLFASILLAPVALVRFCLEELGTALLLLVRSIIWMVLPPYRVREFVRQLDFVGAQTVLLMVLTGAFTGMVSALQGYNGMHRYGAESMVGATVALALSRELGPVIGALMVVARVGSAMAAELGSMRNSQQIDALTSMAVEPIQYLVSPRIFAATIALPFLALIFSFAGMVGAYFVSTEYLEIDPGTFMAGVRDYMDPSDITQGLVKAVVFGVLMALVSCHKGYYATGGSRGVAVATTEAVVVASVLILVSDYLMTTLMFRAT